MSRKISPMVEKMINEVIEKGFIVTKDSKLSRQAYRYSLTLREVIPPTFIHVVRCPYFGIAFRRPQKDHFYLLFTEEAKVDAFKYYIRHSNYAQHQFCRMKKAFHLPRGSAEATQFNLAVFKGEMKNGK